jgi:RNA polymerase nonessential primary-like sigma factor
MRITAQLQKENNFWNLQLRQIEKKRRKIYGKACKKIYGTYEDHNRLFLKWKEEQCWDSRNELIETQLLLVEKYVNELVNLYGSGGLDPRDFIQEGNMALLDALDSFNPQKGNFSSYVRINLMKFILPFLKKNSHTIRHPDTVLKAHTKENQQFDVYYRKHNCFPDVGIIYQYDMKVGEGFKTVHRTFGDTKMENVVSGNTFMLDNQESFDEIFDNIKDVVEEPIIDTYVSNNLKKSMQCLTERENLILNASFVDGKTNQQISELLFPSTVEEYNTLYNNSKNVVSVIYSDNEREELEIYVNLHGLKKQNIQRVQFDVVKGGENTINVPITKNVKMVLFNGLNVKFEIVNQTITFTTKIKNGSVISTQKIAMILNESIIKLRKNPFIQNIKQHIYA